MLGEDVIGKGYVAFICQQCRQPLRLDKSLLDLSQAEPDQLYASLRANTQPLDPQLNAEDHKFDKIVNRSSYDDAANDDFTLLGESQYGHTQTLSMQLGVLARLFDIISLESDVNHPMCEECTDSLLDRLDEQLKESEAESRDYRELLDRLEREDTSYNEEEMNAQLKKLTEEETNLVKQLESVELEREQVSLQIKDEEIQIEKQAMEEESYWHEYNEYKRQLLEMEDAQRSVENQLKYSQLQLDKLKKTNVFNVTFHIWYTDHFGTINNFRIGRLPSDPVEWMEINAGLGQVALLLSSLANKINLTFARYRVVPYGSHSYIELLNDKGKKVPLYGSGGFSLFWNEDFDIALVAMLDCLQQFKEEIEKRDSQFCLPYKMERGRLEESRTSNSYQIKLQFNSQEQWTRALKFYLTNLKWVLAWVSSQFTSR